MELSLSTILKNWQKYQRLQLKNSRHIPESILKDFKLKEKRNFNDISLHLALCDDCSNIYINKLEKEYIAKNSTIAWRKAADTPTISWPQILTSKNGIYKVEIRQSESEKNNGFIIVIIEDKYHSHYEGKTISIVDGKGRQLLRSKIKNGEAFAKIDKLEQIDLKLLIRFLT